jgi:hypothetical protein
MSERIEPLLTIVQVAEWLNRKVGWVYRHTSPKCPPEKRIPVIKMDHGLRFERAAVQRWLAANSTCTEASTPSAPVDEIANPTSHATRYKGHRINGSGGLAS